MAMAPALRGRAALIGQCVLGYHLCPFLHLNTYVVADSRLSPDEWDFAGVRRGEGAVRRSAEVGTPGLSRDVVLSDLCASASR